MKPVVFAAGSFILPVYPDNYPPMDKTRTQDGTLTHKFFTRILYGWQEIFTSGSFIFFA